MKALQNIGSVRATGSPNYARPARLSVLGFLFSAVLLNSCLLAYFAGSIASNIIPFGGIKAAPPMGVVEARHFLKGWLLTMP